MITVQYVRSTTRMSKKHFRAHAEKDDMHAILYAVTAKHRSNRDNEYMKKLRERALKLIEVTEDS